MNLHKLFPIEDLVILDKTQWTDFDKRIWNAFDVTMTDYANPDPTPEAMCRYKGVNALLARSFSVGDGYKLDLMPSRIKRFDIDLLAHSEVFTYANADTAELCYDNYFHLDHVFESDGRYNLYKDVIHPDLKWCLDEICNSLYKFDIMEMFEHIGSTLNVDLIADSYLRNKVKCIIKSKIKAELSTKNSVIKLTYAEWDKVKNGDFFEKMSEATIKGKNIPVTWEFSSVKKHSLRVLRKDKKKIMETTIFDLQVYEEF